MKDACFVSQLSNELQTPWTQAAYDFFKGPPYLDRSMLSEVMLHLTPSVIRGR